jgi:SHS2 domain-containing protein
VSGQYHLREHTADVAVEARGSNLDATFAAVADGLAAASCESIPAGGERFALAVAAESREALLFDYLDELVYQRDVRSVLPVDNEVTVVSAGDAGNEPTGEDAWSLHATARGVPLDRVRAREVKAVTYSQMRLEETPDGWEAYVVFDV